MRVILNLNVEIHDKSAYSVFECIRMNGPITKKGIQQLTGLSWGSISNISARFLAAGVISERKEEAEAVGRRPSSYDISITDNLIMGIDVAMNRIIGHVTSLKGESINSSCIQLKTNEASHVVQELFKLIEWLFQHTPNADQIKCIGLALPGLIDEEEGKPLFVHHFTGAFSQDLLAQIYEKFGVEARIFHDPDCMLASQLRLLTEEERLKDALLIRWSHGIGMSMMLGGKLYNGSHKSAGEIGHMVVNPEGPLCTCGKLGCLEVYASLQSLLKRARMGVSLGLCPALSDFVTKLDEITFEEIFRAYLENDQYVVNILNEAIAHMSMAITNTVNIIDPQVIIIAGEFAFAPNKCIEMLTDFINKRIWRKVPVDIRISNWQSAAAIGAAEMLVKRVYSQVFDTAI